MKYSCLNPWKLFHDFRKHTHSILFSLFKFKSFLIIILNSNKISQKSFFKKYI